MLVSCSTMTYVTRSSYYLTNVETKGSTKSGFANGKFEDKSIYIQSSLDKDVINISILNKSQETMRINWDGGAYIDNNGNSMRIVHSKVKLIDLERAQVPTVIAAGTQYSDNLYVTDYVKIVDGQPVFKPLIGSNAFRSKDEANDNLQPIGSTVKLLLPIEVNGTNREYLFTFTCDKSSIEERREYDATKTYILSGAVGIALGLFPIFL